MLFAFCGAGLGNFVRCKLTKHHLTLFLGIVASVASACVTYTILLRIAELIAGVSLQHEAGYICSMLFIIPGFPFITSGIDLAKLDMRSGLERLTYAIIIIVVATITAWLMALLFASASGGFSGAFHVRSHAYHTASGLQFLRRVRIFDYV